MAYTQHQSDAAAISANCAIVTVSDTRTEATDSSGAAIRRLLAAAGHKIAFQIIVRDEPKELEPVLDGLLSRDDIDIVLTNGGTGISPRDQTICVIERRLDLPLPGFGELFRMLSWQEIGSGAMLSRAVGGVASGKLLFALPGSTSAVELAVSKLIIPEIGHLMAQLRK